MKLQLRLPDRLPFGLRAFFRGAFLLLALATVSLAIAVLKEEKQLSARNYEEGFRRNHAQLVARLQHPTGQLALLNPAAADRGSNAQVTPLRPLLLPFSALDFDDKTKVQQAVEMAGCLVQYPDNASLCVGVGNNPFAGGFIYIAGSFLSTGLTAHSQGDLDLSTSHRVRVAVTMRGQTWRWIAPFELLADTARVGPSGAPGIRGRLTGYVDDGPLIAGTRSVRDFRGWLWQDARCVDADADCRKRSFISIRLPIEIFRDALFQRETLVWPPPDLDQIIVRVQVLGPGDGTPPVFDSDGDGATPPFSWSDLTRLLSQGETLTLRRVDAPAGKGGHAITLQAPPDVSPGVALWLDRLIGALPVDGAAVALEAKETIASSIGSYELTLNGDVRTTVNRSVAAVASRVSWFVVAMLAAIFATWLAIELRIIRRITALTRRAATVSTGVRAADGLSSIDLSDLRGEDELGVLARGLQDLLARVNEDVKRERIRAEQERDAWHAVGHEIMSPLQSLLALHGRADDPSFRYISRMQQAVRVLYGSASPSEAFASTTLELATMDVRTFLGEIAGNAPSVGIDDVRFVGDEVPVFVRADEYSLEDVITHLLRNADRHRTPSTQITISLAASSSEARIVVHNTGEGIDPQMIDRIFEYGVSDLRADTGNDPARRGQGLFVARTYVAKMGGTIVAANTGSGVGFVITLPRVAGG